MAPFDFRSAPCAREAQLKSFSQADEKRVKQASGTLSVAVQRSMGIVMVTVLAIAVLVEIAILVAEIATRARLVTNSLTGRRAA
jgi:hypothetical protein